MPQVVEITVYTIDELSDAAREAARVWYRENCLDYEWYDFVYEDFVTICGILGVTLRHQPHAPLCRRNAGQAASSGGRGFWSQGDGASFEGSYAHAKGAAKAIRAHAPKDDELHRIADALQAVQTAELLASPCTARSASRAATTTNTPCPSRWSGTARPGSRRRTMPGTR